MEANTEKDISVNEARKRLGITRQRVHQLLAAGKLRGARHEFIGGRAIWTVDAESVAEHQREDRPKAV